MKILQLLVGSKSLIALRYVVESIRTQLVPERSKRCLSEVNGCLSVVEGSVVEGSVAEGPFIPPAIHATS